MMDSLHPVYATVLKLIQEDGPLTDEQFSQVALAVYEYQFLNNKVYHDYCRYAGGEVPEHWSEIPALPAAAFKRSDVFCLPREQAVAAFRTSGTTQGNAGHHYFQTLQVYEAAIIPPFRRFLLPDNATLPMHILTPCPEEAPHSSLMHMMKVVAHHLGKGQAIYYVEKDVLLSVKLATNLATIEQSGQPVFLLGTAFSFVHFIDYCKEQQLRFQLPAGSRVMETGGYKGRSRELGRVEFYDSLTELLGIPASSIVNEYGMTELSSQFYDDSFLTQRPEALKKGPAWVRVQIINPVSGHPNPDGEPGLIRIHDLANIGSVACIQTEDVGVKLGDAFRVMGRVAHARPRGCSLDAERLKQQRETRV